VRESVDTQQVKVVLEQRIVDCLEWAADAVSSAENHPERWTPEPRPGEEPEICRPLDKLLNEAALLALVTHRAIGDHPAIARLLKNVAGSWAALDRIYELIRWHPYLWTSLGGVWVVLDRFSLGDPVKRKRLRSLWEEPTLVRPRERVPYRLLDQAWLRSIAAGRSDPLLESTDLLGCSSFGNIEGGLFMSTSDLYAVTHVPMYVTDFGRHGRLGVTPGWVGPLGLWRLLINDLDLAAEFAITDALTTSELNEPTVAIISVLGSMHDALGFIPAPTYRAQDHADALAPADYLFFHTYHSTFVFALLCAVLHTVRISEPRIGVLLAPRPAVIPEEWHGKRRGLPETDDQVAHTFRSWLILAKERGAALDQELMLRGTLDAYLLEAAAENRTDELLQLLGMRRVAGPSEVDAAVRRLLSMRADLSGEESLQKFLAAAA
jgi:hypothetical protein